MARKNKEADKEYWDKWYSENKKKLSKKRREKYKLDPEGSIERVRAWRKTNREKYNAYHREYYKRKKEEIDKNA